MKSAIELRVQHTPLLRILPLHKILVRAGQTRQHVQLVSGVYGWLHSCTSTTTCTCIHAETKTSRGASERTSQVLAAATAGVKTSTLACSFTPVRYGDAGCRMRQRQRLHS